MVWNPGKMVPGMPSMPGPNPQSCTIYCSQSRALGPWGCLGHFQEAQRVQNQAQSAQELTEFQSKRTLSNPNPNG